MRMLYINILIVVIYEDTKFIMKESEKLLIFDLYLT